MVRPNLLCLHCPFSAMVSGRRSFACPFSTTKDACAFFYSFLSEDIRRLEQSLAKDASVSLRWSAEAMNLLKRMQIELIALFKKCKLPPTISFRSYDAVDQDEEEDCDWFNQYMQETATMLDFCNSLKSAISGINRYRMVIDLTLQKLAEGELFIDLIENDNILSSNQQMAMSENVVVSVGKEIDQFQGKYHSRKTSNIDAVMIAARCTMMVISVLLVSAIVSPLSIDIKNEEVTNKFPQLKPFVEMLTALVSQFHEKFLKPRNGSRFLLAEHELVDNAVGELKAHAMKADKDNLLISTQLLRTSSDELRQGLEMFDAVVDQVFEVVIKGRNEMLGVIRDGVLTVG